MAYLKFQNIGIKALAAAVPAKVINNYEFTEFFPPEDVKDVVDKIGVKERRFANPSMCSSDLCVAAAKQLFSDNEISPDEIDLVIFISQTPDYRMPATSIIIQERLGLPKQTAAFDINLGCSGFIYGLSVAYSFLGAGNMRNVLLLDGETRTKVYSSKDRKTGFLFGDGGVAALITRDEKYGESWFSLNSDGSRESFIKINAGGYRIPSSSETVLEKVVDEYGNIRSEEQAYMNGADVFNFLISEVPRDIKNLSEHNGQTLDSFDYYLFHQANDYMNGYLAKKLKIDPEKVPASIHRFGNTSSVSIPLTIVSELHGKLEGNHRVLLSGFGVGMSWATAHLTFSDLKLSTLVELSDEDLLL